MTDTPPPSADQPHEPTRPRGRRDAAETRIAELEARIARLDEQKRHYQWLAESTTDMISRHDQHGNFLYASQAAQELLGYAPQELVGMSAYDQFHPDDLAALLTKSPSIYYHEGFYQQTYRFRAKDGHYVWFETTSRTRRCPGSGELIDILCVSRDVSRRVETEARRERLARVVESTTDYVLFCDANERVLYSNEAARRLFPQGPADGASTLAELYTEPSLADLRNIVAPAVARYGSWSGELTLKGKFGDVPVLSVVLKHRSPGDDDGLSLLNRDIRPRLEAEAQARRHQDQIAHANRLATLGELATNIAHECNQPLATMSNYASGALMQLQRQPDMAAADLALPLARIHDQVERLAQRLRHIRRFVRRGDLHASALSLAEVIDTACELCRWQCDQSGIALVREAEPGLTEVNADPVALEQVLVNLILNALEASRPCANARRILVQTKTAGRAEVTIDVIDQGPGIPAARHAEIFAPFVSSRGDGLGMGLAISHSLCEAMGGSLRLVTQHGEPGAAPAQPPAGPVSDDSVPHAGADRDEVARTASGADRNAENAAVGAVFRITLPRAAARRGRQSPPSPRHQDPRHGGVSTGGQHD
ncbi:PAS domain-containing sensor histidine kinase [Halomonas sp. V046]|uniref:PAS domain-containing sensor histidine kinase n=1 Tax=Halomonas sp. V046 TaxID=3459611 RepID=UPI00404479F0